MCAMVAECVLYSLWCEVNGVAGRVRSLPVPAYVEPPLPAEEVVLLVRELAEHLVYPSSLSPFRRHLGLRREHDRLHLWEVASHQNTIP